jgi:hypothetical protein
MRFILIFLLIYFPVESYSNNLNKILTKSELDSISNGFEISKFTDSFDDMKDFVGVLRIKSFDHKLIYCMIGEWKSFYKDSKNIKAYFKFDSVGCMEIYKEYSITGFNNYDCVYTKKQIGNTHYLIEKIKYYYDNEQLCETGQRFEKVEYNTGYFHRLNSFKKTGEWIRYNDDGTINYKKQHKEIK